MTQDSDYKQFDALNVILVDGKASSAKTTSAMLTELGIKDPRVAANYQEFVSLVSETPADVVVFNAGNKTAKELEFINRVRDEGGEAAFAPILTLSENTTLSDVHNIVNAGTTELVGEPDNLKHIFSRFRHMVDSPRSFVAAPEFKGPDRRRKQQAEDDGETRQSRSPKIVTKAEYKNNSYNEPVVIMPDFSLKVKVSGGLGGDMPPVVEDEFVFWALSDVAVLEASYIVLSEGGSTATHIERICNSCLSVEARSEAYGYLLGCTIARQLSDFCREYFQEGNSGHIIVIEKHIQTLSTVYHGRLRGDGGESGKALVKDLGSLVQKYTS